jgi:hypothetical protein
MEEVDRVVGGHGLGFSAVHHVVRHGGDISGFFRSGDETLEGTELHE